MTLQIVPTRWWSWDFKVADESRPVADIAMSSWREKGELTIDGATYRLYREAPLSGAFVLEGPRGELARAEKPSAFRRTFTIHHARREYTLRPRSMWGRAFVLWDESGEVGSVAPQSFFTRKATAELPKELPLFLQVFVIWLAMLLWRRSSNAAAAAAT